MYKENSEKLIQTFSAALEIDSSEVNDELKYQGIPEWDSISHMFLINEIEHAFKLVISTEHIIDLQSFAKAKEILSKYNVKF